MKTKNEHLYENIGYLFYSIAAADGKVQSPEVEMVKKLVSEEFDPAETSTDEFDTDLAEYIYFTFDYLLNQEITADEAFAQFRNYLDEHAESFDEEMLKKIFRSAKMIAKSYTGIQKAEQYFISELRKAIRKTNVAV